MSLVFDNNLERQFPDLKVLLAAVSDVSVEKGTEELESFKDKVFEEVRESYDLEGLKEVPVFRRYRDFFWEIGIDPTKTRPAAEALVRRVLQGKGLPRINTLVDAYNLASLKSGIPLAAFDFDSLCGDLKIRFAEPEEEFLGIGMDEPTKLDGWEIVVSDSEGLVAIYPYRDAEETKVTTLSEDVLLMVCGVPGVGERLAEAKRTVLDYVTRFCGGEVQDV